MCYVISPLGFHSNMNPEYKKQHAQLHVKSFPSKVNCWAKNHCLFLMNLITLTLLFVIISIRRQYVHTVHNKKKFKQSVYPVWSLFITLSHLTTLSLCLLCLLVFLEADSVSYTGCKKCRTSKWLLGSELNAGPLLCMYLSYFHTWVGGAKEAMMQK